MESLASIESNLRTLLQRYEMLQLENQRLTEENERQREEILRTHGEYVELKTAYNRLQTASALLGGSDERARAKQQITYLIQQVDQAIETLAQG